MPKTTATITIISFENKINLIIHTGIGNIHLDFYDFKAHQVGYTGRFDYIWYILWPTEENFFYLRILHIDVFNELF